MSTRVEGSSARVQPASAARRKNLSVYVGTLLLVLGATFSAAVLERIVLPEGTLAGTVRRAPAWAVCRALLAGLGIYFLVKRPRVTVVHVCVFIFQSVILVILAGMCLQFLYVPPRIESGWRAFAPKTEQNELGFRGQHINYSINDYVVVLIGDSQVEATALPFDSIPERLLESALNSEGKRVKVFSIGAGGYGQDQELLALEEYFQKYRADLVIVWETPENDIWNNVFPTHMFGGSPKPTYWLEEGSLRGPTEALGQTLANSRLVLWRLWQLVFELPRRDKSWEFRLPEPYQALEHYEGPVNREWQDRWDTDRGLMRSENLATEKSHMAIMLSPRSKRMQYGLDLTRALMKRIEQVANFQHANLLMLQVDKEALSTDQNENDMHVLNGKYYRVSKQQFAANLSYLNDGFHTEVIPLTMKDWRVGPEDGHLNRQANEQVMRDLAKHLQRQIPDK